MNDEGFSIIDNYEDEIGIQDNSVGDVIVLKHKDINSIGFVNSITNRLNVLYNENKNRKKMNNILEAFLLNEGYDFKDIIKFLHEKTEEGDVKE